MSLSFRAQPGPAYELPRSTPTFVARDAGTQKGTVLVVDDDAEVLEALCDVLAEEGYEVIRANHGLDALRVLDSHPAPGLIVLDLTMPVMDGYEFLQRRAERPKLASIPVLVVSASIDPTALRNDVHVLRKPIDVDTLLDAVERASLS